jgi:hypothetical protein
MPGARPGTRGAAALGGASGLGGGGGRADEMLRSPVAISAA